MTQTSTTQTLTAPITAAQVEAAPLLGTEIVATDGRVLVPAGRLNWALHNTYDGDVAYFVEQMNAEAADGVTNRA